MAAREARPTWSAERVGTRIERWVLALPPPPARRPARGASTDLVLERGRELARRLGAAKLDGVEWLGPATPQVARLQGFHRRHLLVKAIAPSGIRRALDALRAAPGPTRGVEEQYDVDPVGLL